MRLKDHLEKLSYFYQVGKEGSIKEASSVLGITQPSLTKSIKILEDSVGSDLFVRLPRGVELTKQGRVLFEYCHQLFAGLEDLEARLLAPDDPMSGHLRVGTYDSIAIYFWPKFLRSFLYEFPNLDLELTTNRSHEIQTMVESGELDVGLIIEPQSTAQLGVMDLATDTFQLYAATKMASEQEAQLSAPLIYMPDALAGEKGRLEHMISAQGGDYGRAKHYGTSSLESAKELVINGIGVGLLPKMVAQDAVKKKRIKQIYPKGFPKSGIGKHRIGVVFAKHKKDSRIMKELFSRLKSHPW
ncbi:MAG: LysR family transcriptional regulator [Bdellovibrionales bacterium]|nr:LysR family transcriptional regulator [Bdellovibrionales bacterium]